MKVNVKEELRSRDGFCDEFIDFFTLECRQIGINAKAGVMYALKDRLNLLANMREGNVIQIVKKDIHSNQERAWNRKEGLHGEENHGSLLGIGQRDGKVVHDVQ